jgi:hypothetical protein
VRPILWTLALVCVAYLPVFFGRVLFFRDLSHWSFPARAFLRASLLGGELPQWNPNQALGFSVFADPLYGVFYPPNWLFLLVPTEWMASMQTWQCLAHLLWGAAGVCLLSRRLGGSSRAMTVAGLAWALAGYSTAQWTSGLLLFADAWVPWVVVGHWTLLDSVRRGAWQRGLVKAALPTVFAVLLGEVFLAIIGAGFALVFTFLVERLERPDHPFAPTMRWRWRALAVVAVALGLGAGAIVIVPARTLLGSTERAQSLPRAVAESFSLHPLRVAELVLPHSMGDAYGLYPAASIVGESRLDGLPLSYSVYMGASVFALALAAFGRRRKLALTIGGSMVVALLLAFGRYTPVHGWFRRVAIPLSYMRYPEKYTVLVVLAGALLAGLGATRVLSDKPQPWRRTVILLVTILLAASSVLWLPPAWGGFVLRAVLMAAVATAGVLAAQALAARQSLLASPLLVAVVAFDLAVAAWPLLAFSPRQVASEPAAAKLIHSLEAPGSPPPRVYRAGQTDGAVNKRLPPARAPELESRLLATLITNTVNAWGIATLPGYDAAIPSRVDQVWNAGLEVGQSALRLLAASYVVLPVDDPAAPDDRVGLTPLADPLPGARLYRVQNALPRVFWAARAEVVSDQEALARLYRPDVVAGATVLLAANAPAAVLSVAPARAGECRVEAFANQRVVATCTGQSAGVVTFVEQYDSGWSATVDGQPVPLLRANLIMRALRVQPGSHRIVLEYHTPGLRLGSAISLGCVLLLVGLAVFGRKRGSSLVDECGQARALPAHASPTSPSSAARDTATPRRRPGAR